MQVEFPCGDRILYKLTSSHLQVYYWSRRTIQACNMCLCELNSVSCQSHPSPPPTPQHLKQVTNPYIPQPGCFAFCQTLGWKFRKLSTSNGKASFPVISILKSHWLMKKLWWCKKTTTWNRKSGVPAKVVFSR